MSEDRVNVDHVADFLGIKGEASRAYLKAMFSYEFTKGRLQGVIDSTKELSYPRFWAPPAPSPVDIKLPPIPVDIFKDQLPPCIPIGELKGE